MSDQLPYRRLSTSRFVEGILAGDRSILAKAITVIESSLPADCAVAAEILDACAKVADESIVVGVTGAPGAGKSSLIEALGSHVIENSGEKVAVLAVDPTSHLSGGTILGDKTRMPFLSSSQMAFVRPSPSRGTLGGIAAHTRDAIALCKAAGYGVVFVETVGVGQSETSVRNMVDFLLLVAIAGAGDDLQGIKRGVMEVVEAIAVNKADGENLREAEKACTIAANALHFFLPAASGWTPRATVCSARTGLGVLEVWSQITEHQKMIRQSGYLERMRREQNLACLHENLERSLMQIFMSNSTVKRRLAEVEKEVADGKTNPITAARQLLSFFESDRRHEER